jgi:coenzyme F420-dependent glucose-6-phosphate dehydrogenase
MKAGINFACLEEMTWEYTPKGELFQELPTPAYCSQMTYLVRENNVADMLICGPAPAKHIEKIQAFAKAGSNHVYVYQVDPDREGFCRFYQWAVLPKSW